MRMPHCANSNGSAQAACVRADAEAAALRAELRAAAERISHAVAMAEDGTDRGQLRRLKTIEAMIEEELALFKRL